MAKKIKVIVVDDSAFIRQMFTQMLNEDAEIEVVGAAADPIIAREMIKRFNPDVITLDIEMPKMDGLSFLEKIMSLRPMPVVMVSSLTQKGALETIQALEIGAVDCIGKPRGDEQLNVLSLQGDLIEKIKTAARAKVRFTSKADSAAKIEPLKKSTRFQVGNRIIVIGSSTGGVEALREIIPLMPENSPPVLIVQHMPEHFTKTFSERLNSLSKVNVQEAEDQQEIKPGNVYIAPGNQHLELKINRSGHGYLCKLHQAEKISGHRPSVDVLFDSVAENAGNRAVGVILTGMGKDGARGMLNMKKAGAYNIGQDEESCVVYGMPKAAYLGGAVDEQVSLSHIAESVLNVVGYYR